MRPPFCYQALIVFHPEPAALRNLNPPVIQENVSFQELDRSSFCAYDMLGMRGIEDHGQEDKGSRSLHGPSEDTRHHCGPLE
jgi:hypothetical protein